MKPVRKPKVLLVGGTVVRQHLEEGCFDGCEVVKTYFGMSPLSLGEKPRVPNVDKERLTLRLRYDANHDFKGFLKNNPADYIFIDIQKLLADLMTVDGHYCTYQDGNDDVFYTSHRDSLVHVTEHEYKTFHALFDSFTDMIRARYHARRIVLLSSYVPSCFAVGERVNIHGNRFRYNGWYEHFEKRFARRSGCIYYDKSRYYINDRRDGQPVKYAVFEPEYYAEAGADFARILRHRRYDRKADYAFSVRRYARYCTALDKKFMNAFLNKKDGVDSFLMSCPGAFALAHTEDFVRLKRMSALRRRLGRGELEEIYRAFRRPERSPRNKTAPAELIFAHDIRSPRLLEHLRRHADVAYPKQITYLNYADFYHGTLDRDRLPMPVDIVGCCVSRFIFNHSERDFCVNNYAFHYMPVMADVKATYPKGLLDDTVWEHRMMRLQADCGLREYLSANPAPWVVVDLFPLIELTAFLLGDKPIGSATYYAVDRGCVPVRIYEAYSEDFICAELDKYISLLQEIYGDHIILVASRRQIYKVNEEDRIVPYTNPEANGPRNEAIKRFERYFVQRSGCRYVNIVDQFFADDRSLGSLSPAHYESDCYREEAEIIRRIICERSGQRVFERVSEPTRERRVRRLIRAGNTPEVLREHLGGEDYAALIEASAAQP